LNGYVLADAIRLVRTGVATPGTFDPAADEVTLPDGSTARSWVQADNGDAPNLRSVQAPGGQTVIEELDVYIRRGSGWVTYHGAGGLKGDYDAAAEIPGATAPAEISQATWLFEDLVAGTYYVLATWDWQAGGNYADRANAAPYQINYRQDGLALSTSTVTANQRLAADSAVLDGWQLLGVITVSGGTEGGDVTVTLSNWAATGTGGRVIADAVRLVAAPPLAHLATLDIRNAPLNGANLAAGGALQVLENRVANPTDSLKTLVYVRSTQNQPVWNPLGDIEPGIINLGITSNPGGWKFRPFTTTPGLQFFYSESSPLDLDVFVEDPLTAPSRVLLTLVLAEFGFDAAGNPLGRTLTQQVNLFTNLPEIRVGTKFSDGNANGQHDWWEPALEGATFYLDRNANGVRDAGEFVGMSDINGEYAFHGYDARLYRSLEEEFSGNSYRPTGHGGYLAFDGQQNVAVLDPDFLAEETVFNISFWARFDSYGRHTLFYGTREFAAEAFEIALTLSESGAILNGWSQYGGGGPLAFGLTTGIVLGEWNYFQLEFELSASLEQTLLRVDINEEWQGNLPAMNFFQEGLQFEHFAIGQKLTGRPGVFGAGAFHGALDDLRIARGMINWEYSVTLGNWRFEDPAGSSLALDSSRYQRHLGLGAQALLPEVAPPLWLGGSSARLGSGALGFAGLEHSLQLPGNLLPSFGNNATLEFWLRLDDFQDSGTIFSAIHLITGDEMRLEFDGYGHELTLYLQQGVNADVLNFSTLSMVEGQWHHLALGLDYSVGTHVVYTLTVDNTQRTANSALGVPVMDRFVFGLDSRDNAQGLIGFIGAVDEIRVWNGTRSLAQLQANRGQELDPATAQLRHAYRLNEGSGLQAADSVITGAVTGQLTPGLAAAETYPRFGKLLLAALQPGDVIGNVPQVDIGPDQTVGQGGQVTFQDLVNRLQLFQLAGQPVTPSSDPVMLGSELFFLSGNFLGRFDGEEIYYFSLGNSTLSNFQNLVSFADELWATAIYSPVGGGAPESVLVGLGSGIFTPVALFRAELGNVNADFGLAPANGGLVFIADDPTRGNTPTLWYTDGAGTLKRVLDGQLLTGHADNQSQDFGELVNAPETVVVSPDGTRVLMGGGEMMGGGVYVFHRRADTGHLTYRAFLPLGQIIEQLVFSPDAKHVYARGSSAIDILTWDAQQQTYLSSGSAPLPASAELYDMVLNPAGTRLYALMLVPNVNQRVIEFSRNALTGALTQVAQLANPNTANVISRKLLLTPEGQYLIVGGNNPVDFSINISVYTAAGLPSTRLDNENFSGGVLLSLQFTSSGAHLLVTNTSPFDGIHLLARSGTTASFGAAQGITSVTLLSGDVYRFTDVLVLGAGGAPYTDRLLMTWLDGAYQTRAGVFGLTSSRQLVQLSDLALEGLQVDTSTGFYDAAAYGNDIYLVSSAASSWSSFRLLGVGDLTSHGALLSTGNSAYVSAVVGGQSRLLRWTEGHLWLLPSLGGVQGRLVAAVEIGGNSFVIWDDEVYGEQLWRVDAEAGATRLTGDGELTQVAGDLGLEVIRYQGRPHLAVIDSVEPGATLWLVDAVTGQAHAVLSAGNGRFSAMEEHQGLLLFVHAYANDVRRLYGFNGERNWEILAMHAEVFPAPRLFSFGNSFYFIGPSPLHAGPALHQLHRGVSGHLSYTWLVRDARGNELFRAEDIGPVFQHLAAVTGRFEIVLQLTDLATGALYYDNAWLTVEGAADSIVVSAPATSAEGSGITLQVTHLLALEQATDSVEIRWGDGAVSIYTGLDALATSFGHVYAQGPARHEIQVRLLRGGVEVLGEGWAIIDILNLAPTFELGADRAVNQGQRLQITAGQSFAVTDAGAADSLVAYHWTVRNQGGAVVYESNTATLDYAALLNGIFTVELTVQDSDGAVGHDSFLLTVNNVAPAFDLGAAREIQEAGALAVVVPVSDPGSAPLQVSLVVRRAGNVITSGAFAAFLVNGVLNLQLGHLDGSAAGTLYTLEVTVTDDLAATVRTLDITVYNSAPRGLAAGDDRVSAEGQPLTVSAGAGATDFSPTDVISYQWIIRRADNQQQVASFTGLSFTWTPLAPGLYDLTLTATDGEATVSDSLVLTVLNTAPTGQVQGPTSLLQGDSATFTVAAADPGQATLDYAWRLVSPTGELLRNGTGGTLNHQFNQPGTYSILWTVLDGEGGATELLHAVQVLPRAPADLELEIYVPSAAATGVPVTVSGVFNAFGDGLTLPSVTVDMGDGRLLPAVVIPLLRGDANLDGVVNDRDLQLVFGAMLGHAANQTPFTDLNQTAEGYGDGLWNMADLQVVMANYLTTFVPTGWGSYRYAFVVQHIYAVGGDINVTATVRNANGSQTSAAVVISVEGTSGGLQFNAPAGATGTGGGSPVILKSAAEPTPDETAASVPAAREVPAATPPAAPPSPAPVRPALAVEEPGTAAVIFTGTSSPPAPVAATSPAERRETLVERPANLPRALTTATGTAQRWVWYFADAEAWPGRGSLPHGLADAPRAGRGFLDQTTGTWDELAARPALTDVWRPRVAWTPLLPKEEDAF
jgi:hypothetical protein